MHVSVCQQQRVTRIIYLDNTKVVCVSVGYKQWCI